MSAATVRRLPALLLLLAALAGPGAGCVERTITITSDPPGALVHLNDVEIGRTPCSTRFLHYGTYDLRVTKDGYEPWIGARTARAPLHDLPGPDLVAEVLPLRFENTVTWHVELDPVDAQREGLVDRARDLRADLDPEVEGGTRTVP